MFPGVDGFEWTFGHVVFLALFFAVAATIFITVARAVVNTVRDFRTKRVSEICWNAEFAALPAAERCCRHELAGRVEHRTCRNAFDCRRCPDYEKLVKIRAAAPGTTFGLAYPASRLYHRGHTWVQPEADGVYTIGLDDLASRLVGKPDEVELPAEGARIEANGAAFTLSKGGNRMRVRAPMDGTVIATGGPESGWYLKIRAEGKPDLRHLLRGPEVAAWVGRELERLQIQLGAAEAAPSLADGGILMDGLMDAMPEANWDAALSATFLEA